MKQLEQYKLMDLINQIEKIDSVILLHQKLSDSNFMISQYKAKKTKLVDQLKSLKIQNQTDTDVK